MNPLKVAAVNRVSLSLYNSSWGILREFEIHLDIVRWLGNSFCNQIRVSGDVVRHICKHSRTICRNDTQGTSIMAIANTESCLSCQIKYKWLVIIKKMTTVNVFKFQGRVIFINLNISICVLSTKASIRTTAHRGSFNHKIYLHATIVSKRYFTGTSMRISLSLSLWLQ